MEKIKITGLAKWLFILTSLFLIILLVNQYFQQDEWHSFGLIQLYGVRYVTLDQSLWESILVNRVGARSLMTLFFNVFSLNPIPYGIFSAFIHLFNTFLVYKLSLKLTNKKNLSFIAAFFFLVNSVSYQAYSWFGTVMGSAISVSFVLLSLLSYVYFIYHKKKLFFLISILAIFTSFLFKEIAISLLFLYPAIWFFTPQTKTVRSFFYQNVFFLVYAIAMVILLAYVIITIPGDRANYLSPESSGFIKLAHHALIYPLEGIVQPFVPTQIVSEIARLLTILFVPKYQPETSEFDAFYQTKMTEGVIIFILLSFVILLVRFYKTILNKTTKDMQFAFIIGLFLLPLSYIPYVVLDRFDAYLDSRYYYLATIAASLLFGIFWNYIFSLKQGFKKKILSSIAVVFLASHGFFLFSDLFNQYQISRDRKNIIKQVTDLVPNLQQNTVFYITGNSPGYYGIPELKIPFQSGFGQVLSTIYISQNQLSPRFFEEENFTKTIEQGFLYDTLSQGFKKVDGKGFGYFYDKSDLEKAIKDKLFNKNDVRSFLYDSDGKKIIPL